MHPPGWYPSPHYPDSMQYWSGSEWTAQVQPAVTPVKNNSSMGVRVFSGFFLFVGIVMLSFTVPAVADHLVPDPNQVVATGNVVDVDVQKMRRNDGHKGWVDKCKSTAEFTVDGTQHEAQSQYYDYPCEWKVGDNTKVTYDSRHPQSGAIAGEVSKAMPTTWFFFWAGSGLALAGASIFGVSFLRGRAKK